MLENSLKKKKLQLYAVTDRNCLREKTLYEAVEEALKGGVTFAAAPRKTSSVGAIIKEMKDLHPLCVRYGVPLIVNDSIEIASACNADGVHLARETEVSGRQGRSSAGKKIIKCDGKDG